MIVDIEHKVIKKLSEGDQGAFRIVFEHYYPRVHEFIRRIVKSETIAEDIAQDIFVKLWSMGPSLPEISSFNAYLYRMTKNAAINYLRDRKPSVDISELLIICDGDIEQEYYRKEKELLVRLAVEQMPSQRKRIFTMSRYQGMTNDEIAKSLGLSKHTVENHLSLALKELREIVVAFVLFFLV